MSPPLQVNEWDIEDITQEDDNMVLTRSRRDMHQPTYLTDYECQVTCQVSDKRGTPYSFCKHDFYTNLSLSQREFSMSILNETKPGSYEESSW